MPKIYGQELIQKKYQNMPKNIFKTNAKYSRNWHLCLPIICQQILPKKGKGNPRLP